MPLHRLLNSQNDVRWHRRTFGFLLKYVSTFTERTQTSIESYSRLSVTQCRCFTSATADVSLSSHPNRSRIPAPTHPNAARSTTHPTARNPSTAFPDHVPC